MTFQFGTRDALERRQSELDRQLEKHGGLYPDILPVMYDLARSYIEVGEFRSAVSLFERVFQDRDDISIYEATRASYHLGAALLNFGEFERAQVVLLDLIPEVTGILGSGSIEAVRVLRTADEALILQGKKWLVLETGRDIIDWQLNSKDAAKREYLDPLLSIAQVLMVSGDVSSASAILRRVMHGCIALRGSARTFRVASAYLYGPRRKVVNRIEAALERTRLELESNADQASGSS